MFVRWQYRSGVTIIKIQRILSLRNMNVLRNYQDNHHVTICSILGVNIHSGERMVWMKGNKICKHYYRVHLQKAHTHMLLHTLHWLSVHVNVFRTCAVSTLAGTCSLHGHKFRVSVRIIEWMFTCTLMVLTRTKSDPCRQIC